MAPMKSTKAVKKVKKVKGGKVEISKLTGKPKIVRRDCGRKEAQLAAKMTQVQWLKFRTAQYAEAWPKPAYMAEPRDTVYVRDGGDGAYRQKTYEIVTRWTAETQIEYRPHAKAPGSKSHLRYEKYSKAKTVGQSLKLGSWPLDWCHDYEHGFLRVTGGKVRDEPIDISKVTDQSKMTDVDFKIYRWFKRELCKRCGLSPDDLASTIHYNESLWQRAHRLMANRYADDYLEEARQKKTPITREQVVRTLKAWAFGRNTGRQNVMPKDRAFVWSDTVGLLRDRVGHIHVTGLSKRYPAVVRLINAWLKSIIPAEIASFTYTSINLNCNYAAKRHRDGNNFGPSLIVGGGAYSGGGLSVWPEDDKSQDLRQMPSNKKVEVDISENLVMFNGNSAHEVADFEGERFSIVFFACGCHAKTSDEVKQEMEALGFVVPPKNEKPDRLLRRPMGYEKPKASSGKDSLRSWPLKRLERNARVFKPWFKAEVKQKAKAKAKAMKAAKAKASK